MITSQEVTVGGNQYIIGAFSGREGVKMAMRLARVLSPVVPALVEGEKHKREAGGGEDEMNEKIIGALFSAFGSAIHDADEVSSLMFDLVKTTMRKTEQGGAVLIDGAYFDGHFARNYSELIRLIVEVVKYNFADFFTGPTALLGDIVTAVEG